jgi:hypothetical protein
MDHCEAIPYKVQMSTAPSVIYFFIKWKTLTADVQGRMATETFENMTYVVREKMLEVSIIPEPKKARHTFPVLSAC